MTGSHTPVMPAETLESLEIKPDGVYLDMTLGGFGHGSLICSKLSPEGLYIGLDLDSEAIEAASRLTGSFANRFILEQTHFSRFAEILARHGVTSISGCLIDMGVSSTELDDGGRGFSFSRPGPIDMRMDRSAGFSAFDIVNGYTKEELTRIFREYGEERFAPGVASAIVRARKDGPLTTTTRLADVISSAVPAKFRRPGRHPATKSFLALRVETNQEYAFLESTIDAVIGFLEDGAPFSVITFNSVEDRIVKQTFVRAATGCICPPGLPVCACGKKPAVELVRKKPQVPSPEEVIENPRSRSAKLRTARRLARE